MGTHDTSASGPYRTLSERLAAEAAAGGYSPGTWAGVTLQSYVTDIHALVPSVYDALGVRLDSNDACYLRGALFMDVASADSHFDWASGTLVVATLPEVFWPEKPRFITQTASAFEPNGVNPVALPASLTVGIDGVVIMNLGVKGLDGTSVRTALFGKQMTCGFTGEYHPE